MRRLVLATSILGVVAVPQVLAATYLTASEFESKVVGKTLSSATKKGQPFTAKFASGGGGMFKLKNMDPVNISWSFSGYTMCWKVYGNKECNKIEQKGSKLNFIDAKTGKLNNSYAVK